MDNLKKKKNILKGLSLCFTEIEETKNLIPEKERRGYISATNVEMIIPKTREFKKLLIENYDVKEEKIPDLDFKANAGEEQKALLNTESLNVLLNLNKAYKQVDISVKKDMPLKFETEDFVLIVAPRIRY